MKHQRKEVVVQVVQHLRAGGIECLVLEMMRSSQIEQKESMHIISLEGSIEEALSLWPRLLPYKKRLHFANKPSGISFSCLFNVMKLLRNLNADVVHSHHIGPLFYAGIAARLVGVSRCVHTEHDAWHMKDIKRRKLESLLLRWVKPTLVADAYGVQEMLNYYQPGYPTHTIYNGVDCDVFHMGSQEYARAQLGLPKENVRIIGCAGRLTPVKGHRYLIEATKYLPEDCLLVLAGEGEYQEELEWLITRHNLESRVVLLGKLENMVLFYQALDVFCMSSINEGLPLSPLEAQACGIPVVLTDVGGCREACCPDTGIMVPEKNSAALAWAIRTLLKKQIRGDIESPRCFITQQRDFITMFNEYRVLYNTASS
jgi:glycosyltransferase involved in cell wall biosynthesis